MRSPLRRVVVLMTALLTTCGLSGCFGHSDEHHAAGSGGSTASPAVTHPLQVRSAVTRVAGELKPDARQHLAAKAGALVQTYLRAAFLDPRAGKASPAAVFPGFTTESRTLASHDRSILTGASYAGADRIEPVSGTAHLNVVAPHGRAVGATAWVRLTLRVTDDGRTRPVQVAGRLLLTPTPQGWRIFGYDLSQSGAHARSTR